VTHIARSRAAIAETFASAGAAVTVTDGHAGTLGAVDPLIRGQGALEDFVLRAGEVRTRAPRRR
jgi:hypothetical protein